MLNKRGISNVITVVLIIILSLVALIIVWTFLSPVIFQEGDLTEIRGELLQERFNIKEVEIDENGVTLKVTVQRGETTEKFVKEEKVPGSGSSADIVYVTDLSGSMAPTCSNMNPVGETPAECCARIAGNAHGSEVCRFENGLTIDKSIECINTCGGVYENKIKDMVSATSDLVDQILTTNSNNKMGIVPYDSAIPANIFSGKDANVHSLKRDKSELLTEINSWDIDTSGNTWICGGINEASSLLDSSGTGRQKAIIVLTDGIPSNIGCGKTTGRTGGKEQTVYSACQAYNKFNDLAIYTVGFGSDVNGGLLTSTAQPGKHKYSDVECSGIDDSKGQYFPAGDEQALKDVFKEITEKIIRTTETLSITAHLIAVFHYGTAGETISVDLENPPKMPFETTVYNLVPGVDNKLTPDILKETFMVEIYPVAFTADGEEVVGSKVGTYFIS